MPCKHVHLPGGGVAIVKMGNTPRKKCSFCNSWCVALCDGRDDRKKSGTCDARMCEFHRHRVGENLDLCEKCVKTQSDVKPAGQTTLFP